MNWTREIAILCLVKKRLAEVNVGHSPLWPATLPNAPASNESILEVEKKLDLGASFRAFLTHANGWRAIFQKIDLFGTTDLTGGPRFDTAHRLLDSIDDVRSMVDCPKENLLPIAVSENDIDLFVMASPAAKRPGSVFWLADELIDSFASFDEYFLAMVDYNRREIQRFEGKLPPTR
jgi:SMI1/KNR4 family protein SUKH-1